MQRFDFPLVTIVVPVFNGERYLAKAIRSLLDQSYSQLEILVVDDGSHNQFLTERIATSFSDKRIKYIRKENGGVSTALNVALKTATGKYFTWLSHDDAFMRDKILTQVQILESFGDKKVVQFSSYQTIDANDKVIHTAQLTGEMSKSVTPLGPIERGILYGCAAMFSLDFLKSVGDFDEDLRFVQDYDYWLKLVDHGAIFHLIDRPLVKIRIHKEQTGKTNNTYDENFILWEEIAEKWVDYCRAKYDDKTNLRNLVEYKNFAILNKVEGAVPVLDNFQKEILQNYRLSVIVPIKGRLHLLGRCIKSVLDQSFNNIEIIVVDDNTNQKVSDKTLNIISSFKDSSIVFQKNYHEHGPAGSRNQGLETASGDFIAFLDSDDYFMPGKLTLQLTQMIIDNVDFSHTNYLRYYEDDGRFKVIDTSHHSGNDQLTYILEHGCGISTSTVMIRYCEPFNGIRFDEDKRFGEDIFYFLDFAHHSDHEFLHLNFPGTVMRLHAESAASSDFAQTTHLNDIKLLIDNRDPNRQYYGAGITRRRKRMYAIFGSTKKVTQKFFQITRPCRYLILKMGSHVLYFLPLKSSIKAKLNQVRAFLLK